VFGIVISLATLAAVIGLSVELRSHGVQTYRLGGWPTPLGIHWEVDGLSMVMLLMTSTVAALISIYAGAYFRGQTSRRHFWPLWLFLCGGLNALYVSADLFNLYVVLEVVGLSAVALAALPATRAALLASLRYLIATMVASLSFLFGVGLIYAEYGVLDLRLLSDTLQASPATSTAFALMMLGLLMKTALFPLHFWLPPAHSAAPAPVSAALSALVIKGSFYLALRLWFFVFDPVVTFEAGQMVGALGAAAILWGSFQAMRQQRLKMLIAHSSVGQVGYLFLIFPLATVPLQGGSVPWLTEAAAGGIFHALSHGFAKAAMFLAAGVIITAAGCDKLISMRNIAGRLPLTTFAFALAGVSLIGLPPSGGFVAKWMIMKAILASGQWWWVPVVLAGSLLTAGYVFLMIRWAFKPALGQLPLKPVGLTMQLVPLLLAILAVLAGVIVQEPVSVLKIGTDLIEERGAK
jgi:formate hydrogenlyase subunit 3/multisubunit Na+/H+ antiporter MnhD subunit